MNCPNCGAPINPLDVYCPSCGINLIMAQHSDPVQTLPPENRPLSPWAYFGYSLLFAIPLIGLIAVAVIIGMAMAFGFSYELTQAVSQAFS